eukprot:Rmarinus@m.12520
MCGDGTNDMGALRHATVGIALVSSTKRSSSRVSHTSPKKVNPFEEENTIVKFGDASTASSFTSRKSSISSTVRVIQQGRCTLVTTIQMYKILALNSLITAYSLSALMLDGFKMGDTQVTMCGLWTALCFLFLSRSKPLPTLAPEKPVSTVFDPMVILSIVFQFAVHLWCLFSVVSLSRPYLPPDTDLAPDAEFSSNTFNSSVFLMWWAMNSVTFLVNYSGRPFMEPMYQNKGFSIMVVGSVVMLLAVATNYDPMLNANLEFVVFPEEVSVGLRWLILGDLAASLIISNAFAMLISWRNR